MNFKMLIDKWETEMIRDVLALCRIPSVRDENSRGCLAPFGQPVRRAFDEFISIACRLGFSPVDFDGYALHVKDGEQTEDIAVLGHLDVVPADDRDTWITPPFSPVISQGYLVGRGVNDDKGPLIAALYCMRILADCNYPRKRAIRLIAGGAEETTWECMDYYFARNPQPFAGFSPDGNFPIVNGEKGILTGHISRRIGNPDDVIELTCSNPAGFICHELKITFNRSDEQLVKTAARAASIQEQEGRLVITYTGVLALSRNPHCGTNALYSFAADFYNYEFADSGLTLFIRYLTDFFAGDDTGRKAGLFSADEQMGETTFCPTGLLLDHDRLFLYFDYRFPKSTNAESAKKQITARFGTGNQISFQKEVKPLYAAADSELIRSLQTAYRNVTGKEANLLTKGGMSYARALEHGVAFGPTFDGETPGSHFANEKISIASLKKAMEIYCEALYLLTVDSG